ncbi:MAG: hypothetical protein EDM69_00140 [Chlorobiota bacterium]|nr:MAG: hypothetical protein EDM69_00140 [Chlorobiota bacterium]MCC6886243.1 lysophospholipid acyltransferase family protein [Ignavibacteriales bacterium]MCE7952303.1 hypothetical protein [Chlorobi bacterium CHB7]RIK48561.1 MAG: hypothetical protein DCC60_07085 [Ignavibacteriota bacterium]
MFFYLIPIRKKVADDNLKICFPEKDNQFRDKIIKQAYRNLFITLFEILYFPSFDKSSLTKLIRYNNYQVMDKALSGKRGVILASMHYSNWELTAFAYPFFFGQSLNIIYRTQADTNINRSINEYRAISGNNLIGTGGSLREIFEILNSNGIVAFMVDQSANPKYSVYPEFFGIKTATFSGSAKIALKLNVPVVFAYGERMKDNTYNITFKEIQNPFKNDIESLTQQIQAEVESVIKKNPDQWFWFHRRFKHRLNEKS